MNKTTNPIMMLIIALILLTFVFVFLTVGGSPNKETFWFLRVLTAISAAAISMSLSGTVNIGAKDNIQTLAETTRKITAAGALAIFMIVYLFNPVSFTSA